MHLSKRQLKRIIREEYSRLKFRGLIKESVEPEGEFQELVYELLQAGGKDADSVGWLLTVKDHDLRRLIVGMGLGKLYDTDPEYPDEGEGISSTVPGREHEGLPNKQTGEPTGITRATHFVEFPDVAIEFLQNAQYNSPRAYAALERKFFKTATKWGLI